MDHGNWFGALDAKVGFISGAVCGVIKLLDIYLLTDAYTVVLVKVLLTGIVGGFGGVLGRHLFSFVKDRLKRKFKNQKK